MHMRLPRTILPVRTILFVLWGLMLAFVGLTDTANALSLGDRLSSALLATAGIAIISAEIVSWARSSRRDLLVALTASGLSFFVGAVIYRLVNSNFASQPRLLAVAYVIGTITVLSLAALMWDAICLVRRTQDEKVVNGDGNDNDNGIGDGKDEGTLLSKLSKHGAAVGAAATILAALIALPQFWYSNQYLPSTATPVLSIKSKLSSPYPHRFGLAATTAQIEIRNTGNAPVTILTSIYRITGTAIRTPLQVTAEPDPGRVPHATNDNPGPSARYSTFSLYGPAQLIQFGQLVLDQAWLEPDEYTTATVVAYFPQDKFDMLRLTTDMAFVREDRIAIDENITPVSTKKLARNSPLVKGCEGLNVYLTIWPVKQYTLFRRLTESDREVVIALVAGPARKPSDAVREASNIKPEIEGQWSPAFPQMYASIQHTGRSCGHVINPDSTSHGLEDHSMFSQAGSVSEVEIPRRTA